MQYGSIYASLHCSLFLPCLVGIAHKASYKYLQKIVEAPKLLSPQWIDFQVCWTERIVLYVCKVCSTNGTKKKLSVNADKAAAKPTAQKIVQHYHNRIMLYCTTAATATAALIRPIDMARTAVCLSRLHQFALNDFINAARREPVRSRLSAKLPLKRWLYANWFRPTEARSMYICCVNRVDFCMHA